MLDNIYVINLDKSKDRLDELTKNFNKYGVKFTKFSAIYGKDLDAEEINKRASMLCRHFLCNYSMIGCAMSHFSLWEKLSKDPKNEYYIIMEDDAQIDGKFKEVIRKIERDSLNGKLNFDILSLYCWSKLNCFQFRDIHRITDDYIIGISLYPNSTASYIISKKGANKILQYFKKINYHLDIEIAIRHLFNDLIYYTISPNLVTVNNTDTTIGTINTNSITLLLFKSLNLHKIVWWLNTPVFCVQLKYCVSHFLMISIIILLINYGYFNSVFIYIFVIFELVLYYFY